MKKFWSFVKSTRSQPENLSLILITSSVRILPKLLKNSMIFSPVFFTHNDHTVEITSPELEVQNICIMSFSSDMVLDRIKKLGADKAVGPDNIYRAVC